MQETKKPNQLGYHNTILSGVFYQFHLQGVIIACFFLLSFLPVHCLVLFSQTVGLSCGLDCFLLTSIHDVCLVSVVIRLLSSSLYPLNYLSVLVCCYEQFLDTYPLNYLSVLVWYYEKFLGTYPLNYLSVLVCCYERYLPFKLPFSIGVLL